MSLHKKAVILLSGGLDSATCLAIAKNEGYELHSISFQYGQRHCYELERAKALVEKFGVQSHRVIEINLGQFGCSALTDINLDVPKNEDVIGIGNVIPITYVPARNTVFLSLALAFAETISSQDLFIGVNALDYSGYPDCRREYIEAFEKMANLATKLSVEDCQTIRIHTPLIDMTKAEIIECGLKLGVDYGMTLSCYDPHEGGVPCQKCDACLLRLKGFRENGISDPTVVPID